MVGYSYCNVCQKDYEGRICSECTGSDGYCIYITKDGICSNCGRCKQTKKVKHYKVLRSLHNKALFIENINKAMQEGWSIVGPVPQGFHIDFWVLLERMEDVE